ERERVDDFYAARSSSMPPLPWPNFSPPFSALVETQSFFIYGESMVWFRNGRMISYRGGVDKDVPAARAAIEEYVEYHEVKGKAQKSEKVRFPGWVIRDALTLAIAEKLLPEITGMSNIPGIDWTTGETYGWEPGYHEPSKTYFLNQFDRSTTTRITNMAEAKTAAEALLEPFALYTLRNDGDRSALLAAIIGTTLRSALPTAPGIMIHAPLGSQSTGKTPMQTAIVKHFSDYLSASSWKGDAEFGKYVTSWLRNLNPIIMDNVKQGMLLTSETLASLLTSSSIKTRILGMSDGPEQSTAVPVVFSMSGYSPDVDTTLRFLEIGLRMGKKIQPDWQPIDKVNRERAISLSLGLVEWLHRDADRHAAFQEMISKIDANHAGSKFHVWDRNIRVLAYLLTGTDPMKNSIDRYVVDGDANDCFVTGEVMKVIAMHIGLQKPFEARDIEDLLTGNLMEAWCQEQGKRNIIAMRKHLPKLCRDQETGAPGRYGDYILECISVNPVRKYVVREAYSPEQLLIEQPRKKTEIVFAPAQDAANTNAVVVASQTTARDDDLMFYRKLLEADES
ncbi:hypothetical protein MR829_22915, partial [Paracoccus versutus]|uniref:hypothetical protein n=1 Tax=Paracoccus versutus TaxID=34007 RepID=UPI001FB698A0